MKKIIALIPLLVFLNCGPEAVMYKRSYLIENSLQKPIIIEFYKNEIEQLFFSVNLLPGEKFEGLKLEQDQPYSELTNNYQPRTSFKSTDSLVIMFDNSRLSTFSNEIDSNGIDFSKPQFLNLHLHENYENIGNDQFLYRITDEDYQNATPCDGECE